MSCVRRYIVKGQLSIVGFLAVIFLSFIILLFVTSSSASAAQTIPYKINYQGRLTNSAGSIVANGLYNIKFTIFDASTGGTQKWQESRETTTRVQITNGLFDVRFGDVTALTPALFGNSTQLYLQVELPTPATATCATAACASFTEGPLSPRQPIAASPYAFNADTVDGIDGSSLARSDQANTFSGNQTIGGNVTATNLIQGSNNVCDISNNCGDVRIGGNSTGAKLLVGANDSQEFGLKSGGYETITLKTDATAVIGKEIDYTGSLVNTATLKVINRNSGNVALYVQGAYLQTTELVVIRPYSGTASFNISQTGEVSIRPNSGANSLSVKHSDASELFKIGSDKKLTLGESGSGFGAIKKATTTWNPPPTVNGLGSKSAYDFGKKVVFLGAEIPATPTCGGTGCSYSNASLFDNIGGDAYTKSGSTNTSVTMRFDNRSGATVDPPSSTWTFWYLEP